ncbi:MAG: hypothetical protein HYZ48_00735 [Chlamydiales bacterium]|nr:hypothetical protein [Chlamydiales bacterium]
MDHLLQIGKLLGVCVSKELPIRSFQQDSRLVGDGDLFFALEGEKVDGHSFLEEVAGKKAVVQDLSERQRPKNSLPPSLKKNLRLLKQKGMPIPKSACL